MKKKKEDDAELVLRELMAVLRELRGELAATKGDLDAYRTAYVALMAHHRACTVCSQRGVLNGEA